MSIQLRREPFSTPGERTIRLQLFSLLVVGAVVLLVWNPTTHPGPKCCWLRYLFGVPCPTCGMTRAAALVVRGQPLKASTFNPLVLPCLLLFVLLGIKWAYEYTANRRLRLIAPPSLRLAFWALFTVVILINWAYLLTYRREDDFASSWLGKALWWWWSGAVE
jgi:hypothetical protein